MLSSRTAQLQQFGLFRMLHHQSFRYKNGSKIYCCDDWVAEVQQKREMNSMGEEQNKKSERRRKIVCQYKGSESKGHINWLKMQANRELQCLHYIPFK